VVVNGDQIFIGNSKKVVEAAKEGMWTPSIFAYTSADCHVVAFDFGCKNAQ
jgi:hypothetical protein